MLLTLSCFLLQVQNRENHSGRNTIEMKEKAKQRVINDEHQQLETENDGSHLSRLSASLYVFLFGV